MTTIFKQVFQCPKCNEKFVANVLGSCSSGGTDETLCAKFFGMNPMPFFTTKCPDCDYSDFLANFTECDDDPEKESWLQGEQGCGNFDVIAERMIKEENPPESIGIIFHHAGCCRKLMGGDPKEQFKHAVKYFKLAQKTSISEIGDMPIEEIIEKLS